MSMIENRIASLLQLLLEGTQRKKLEWTSTADEDTFRLTSEVANIRISKSDQFDQDAQNIGTLRQLSILNDKGRVIEEFDPSSMNQEFTFDTLFSNARRVAYKTEETLDLLINDIVNKINQSGTKS